MSIRKRIQALIAFAAAVCMLLGTPCQTYALAMGNGSTDRETVSEYGESVQEGQTKIVYTSAPTGFRQKDGKTYYYINNKMQTGWKTINGKKYYFQPSGSNKGVMMTGRRKIGNYYYYLCPEMKTGLIKAGDVIYYYAGSDGHLKTGWQTVNGKKYYFWAQTQNGHKQNEAAVGVKSINGTFYLFTDDGQLRYGLNEHHGKMFYTDSKGRLQKGFVTISGKKYYFNANSNKFEGHEGKLNVNGKYYVCRGGLVMTGLVEDEGDLYYAGTDGVLKSGWQTINGKRYYFLPAKTSSQPTRAAVIGEYTIDGTLYYFHEEGTLDEERTVETGLVQKGGKWHFFYQTDDGIHKPGDMAKSPVFFKGNYYYFDSSGDPVTGWQMVDGNYAYFDEKGMYVQNKAAMKLTVIDYGSTNGSYGSNYGDATLMESNGEFLLLDTCMPGGGKNIIKKLKEMGAKNLSIYISHYHDDHIGAVPAILKDSYFSVRKLYLPDASYMYGSNKKTKWFTTHTALYEQSVKLAKQKGVEIVTLKAGDTLKCGFVNGTVLFQQKKPNFTGDSSNHGQVITYINNHSLVTMFECGQFRFLTAGDIETSAEKDLLAKGLNLRADIFKLSHHGGSSSNTKALLEAIKAKAGYYTNPGEKSSLLQDGWCKPVINRAQSLGMNLFHPLINGHVTFSVSGGSVFVSGVRRTKTVTVNVRNKVTGNNGTYKVTVQGAANGKNKAYENMIPFYYDLR